MTLPDTRFLLTLVPIVLVAAVTAFVIVAAFAWLNASRRAEKAETEAEQLRLEKDQEYVAKHLALTERDSAVRAFQVREDELRELENRLADVKAEAVRLKAALHGEQQRREEVERLAARPPDEAAALPINDETAIALTATVERLRAELEHARVELARKDARLDEVDALKRQLEVANTRMLDAQTAAQREAEKVAQISTAAGDALQTESQLRARALAAEAALVPGASEEIAARIRDAEAERDAALGRVSELQKRVAQHEAEWAAQQSERARLEAALAAAVDHAATVPSASAEATDGAIAALEAELKAARAELAAMRTNAPADPSAVADLERELGEARAELARRGARIAELVSLAGASAAGETPTDPAAPPAPAPDARDGQIAQLTADLAAARATPEAAELSQLRDALASAQADIRDQDSRIALLRSDLHALTLRAAALTEEKAALAASLDKARAESEADQAQLASLSKAVSAFEARAQLDAQNNTSPRMASSLKATETPGSGVGSGGLSAQLADARARGLALEQILAERDRRIEALAARLSQTERAMANQAAALKDAQAPATVAPVLPETDSRREQGQTEAGAQGGTDKDEQIATLRRQLDESMSNLRRAMEELADRDARQVSASVRVDAHPAGAADSANVASEAADAVDANPAERSPNRKPQDDALEEIVGIGPTIARRLRMAGIRTFRQVAETPPNRLEEIARLPDWRKSNFKAWIEQARELAGDG